MKNEKNRGNGNGEVRGAGNIVNCKLWGTGERAEARRGHAD